MRLRFAHTESHQAETRPGAPTRIGSGLFWYGVPALAVAAVLGYIGLALAWHANPPLVPVVGTSMRPALHAGDVVFLKGVDPRTLKVGDVIGFRVPKATQQKYNLPSTYVHRIVHREKGDRGFEFRTQGDAVQGPDPFWVPESDVVGKMVARGPALGYPILFFRSKQGRLFALATLAILLVYFLLGVFDRRRELADMNVLSLAALVGEARELKESMQSTVTNARGPPEVAQPVADQAESEPEPEPLVVDAEPEEPDLSSIPPERRALHLAEYQLAPAYRTEPDWAPTQELSTALVPYVPPQAIPPIDFARLEEEIHRAVSSSEDVKGTMRELVGAIGEYGEHLRSHTDVMKNIAASTGELQAATAEMRTVLLALAQAVERLADRQAPDGPR